MAAVPLPPPTPLRRPAPPARATRPDDLDALAELLDRCSPETLYRRFHGAVGAAVRHELVRMSGRSARHRSWLVEVDGVPRGTATLAWGRDGVPEAAFLVEDAWFRRGIGRRLFEAVAREARAAGVPAVVAYLQAENARARRFLEALAPNPVVVHLGGGDLAVRLPVTATDDALVPSIDPATSAAAS